MNKSYLDDLSKAGQNLRELAIATSGANTSQKIPVINGKIQTAAMMPSVKNDDRMLPELFKFNNNSKVKELNN